MKMPPEKRQRRCAKILNPIAPGFFRPSFNSAPAVEKTPGYRLIGLLLLLPASSTIGPFTEWLSCQTATRRNPPRTFALYFKPVRIMLWPLTHLGGPSY